MTCTSRVLFLLLPLFIFLSASAHAASNTEVTAFYFVKDPASSSGYTQKIKWVLTKENEWEKFYQKLPTFPIDVALEPDPFLSKVDDIIVLSKTDSNKISGVDVYISTRGISVIKRGAAHYYYPDTNGFRKFLEEEQTQRSSFDSFDREKIDPTSEGIVVTYNVNRNIPNPTWLIDHEEDLGLYDSFLQSLKPYENEEAINLLGDEKFDGFDRFILNLNYPNAPAKVATVSLKHIRLSNPDNKKEYLQDPENYYNYFKTQALEMMDYRDKYKQNEGKAAKRSRF